MWNEKKNIFKDYNWNSSNSFYSDTFDKSVS